MILDELADDVVEHLNPRARPVFVDVTGVLVCRDPARDMGVAELAECLGDRAVGRVGHLKLKRTSEDGRRPQQRERE